MAFVIPEAARTSGEVPPPTVQWCGLETLLSLTLPFSSRPASSTQGTTNLAALEITVSLTLTLRVFHSRDN